MTTDGPIRFGDMEFVRVEHAALPLGDVRVVWAEGGVPAVLDRASATLLDCFSEPATPDQLADDLVDVVGLDRDDARRASATAAHWMRNAGLLMQTDREPMEPWRLHYPTAAST